MKTGVLGTGTPTNKERLLAAYAAYNRLDGAALLALVSEDVTAAPGCTARPSFGRIGLASGR